VVADLSGFSCSIAAFSDLKPYKVRDADGIFSKWHVVTRRAQSQSQAKPVHCDKNSFIHRSGTEYNVGVVSAYVGRSVTAG
jgi:hypothetical protein